MVTKADTEMASEDVQNKAYYHHQNNDKESKISDCENSKHAWIMYGRHRPLLKKLVEPAASGLRRPLRNLARDKPAII